jgi:uncharacterized protein involved in exopolysaccharide biosynthesis
MSATSPNPSPQPLVPSPAEPPVAAYDLAELVGFASRSPRRHPRLALTVFAVTAVVSLLAAAKLPRTYGTETKILAQRNLIMAALGNPRRSIPQDADAPTRGVVEAILERENLIAVVKDADLIDRWMASRSTLMRWKDQLVERLGAKPSEEDRMRAMVAILEKKVTVTTDEGVITIGAQWDSPQIVYDIVSATQRRFLDRRAEMETSTIVDTIAILETDAGKARAALSTNLAEVIRLANEAPPSRAAAPSTAPASGDAAPVAVAPRAPKTSSEDAASIAAAREIEAKLESKRKEIRNLEEPWERTIADQRAKLAELKSTYASAHPLVLEQERKLSDISTPPADLVALRLEEKALLAREDELPASVTGPYGLAATTPAPAGGGATTPTPHAAVAESPRERDDPPALVAARARLQTATRKYEDIVDRIDGAKIELETARAAFKYRYRVTLPPEIPTKALKPNPPLLAGGGIVLGVLLGLFAALAKDIVAGRFLEVWQVRRRLPVPLLAEVDEP